MYNNKNRRENTKSSIIPGMLMFGFLKNVGDPTRNVF